MPNKICNSSGQAQGTKFMQHKSFQLTEAFSFELTLTSCEINSCGAEELLPPDDQV